MREDAVDNLIVRFDKETLVFPQGYFSQLIVALVIILASLVAGLVFRHFVLRYISTWAAKTSTRFDDTIVRSIRRPILVWFLLIGATYAVRVVELPSTVSDLAGKSIYVLLSLSIAYSLALILAGFVRHFGAKLGAKGVGVTSIGEYVVKIFVLGLGVMFVLDGLGISITPLLASLGIGALAVALALQPSLQNIFAGIYILADKPVRVGDYIKLESGEEGYVVDIGWRSTRIRMLSNNMVIVPNEKLAGSIVTNYYLPDKRMALLIDIGVTYDTDPDKVEKVLVDEATRASYEIDGMIQAKEAQPFVRFIPGFMDYYLGFKLICQVREFVDQYYVQHELRKRIYKRFKKEGIEIPFPIRTVELKDSRGIARRK